MRIRGPGEAGTAGLREGDEAPLRAALFNSEQMQQHGRTLAASHRLGRLRFVEWLLPRLAANESALAQVFAQLTDAVAQNRPIAPAGEWLIDNAWLIEEQIRTARAHLPQGYSRGLPRLAAGPSTNLPRVYDLALETISHGDGRFDPVGLARFVSAYQDERELNLGELWAIPIMLRLALIENLRRIAVRIGAAKADRDLADTWADHMTEAAQKNPKGLILVLADMARSTPPMSTAFVAELERRLQGQGPALSLPLTWMAQLLGESQLTIRQQVQAENQQLAADQVSVSNSIGSLRTLSTMDWRSFVESVSSVERTLREDPGGAYAGMDFTTRDRYRHVVERVARRRRCTELAVAQQAVRMARAVADADAGRRDAHVGYYLIDDGLVALDRALRPATGSAVRWDRFLGRLRAPFRPQGMLGAYLGSIGLLTLLGTWLLLREARDGGLAGASLIAVGALALVATSQLAVALTNWIASLLVQPKTLARMDFSEGIPAPLRTLVAVPSMVRDTQDIDALVGALEVRFLANRDANLHFALLTDFEDASVEHLPHDDELIDRLEDRIAALNRHYGSGGPSIFFLFHRPRRWNPGERAWMGHERKRGKLADLNAVLRGEASGQFTRIVGDLDALLGFKYVITLDTDTQLPRDSARQMVGALAHPLNRAVFGPDATSIVQGYGILQPRVAISLTAANRSRYAQLFGGETGIDPYTRAVSDLYQDLFAQGSFIGKGIYDIDAVERVIGAKLPPNRILSHDLLEGCYARSGLLSDVQLIEDHPSRYLDDVRRRHRWMRGDWQLLGWLWPRVAGVDAKRVRNPLSPLSRWKLLDNLRRSLVAPALTVLFLAGWLALATPTRWTLMLIAIVLAPSFIALALPYARKPPALPLRAHLADTTRAAGLHLAQAGLLLACLPFEALVSLDAIGRTLWRMLFTRRRLLEWKASDATPDETGARDATGTGPDRGPRGLGRSSLASSYRAMGGAVATAATALTAIAVARPGALPIAVPFLALWLAAPAILWWMGCPLIRREAQLSGEQAIFLRRLSRRTWAFFDTFVGPDDHWLPPDNLQEHPVGVIAHRTSPTNMGLSLLANLAAYDFGYLSAGGLAVRTRQALDTMERLERFRGHFYNWYDTKNLQRLNPPYVSTVDSGNLSGHLLTLRAGIEGLADEPILSPRWCAGLVDTVGVLRESLGGTTADRATKPDAAFGALERFEQTLNRFVDAPAPTTADACRALDALLVLAGTIVGSCADDASEPRVWALALQRQCADWIAELDLLVPWIRLPAPVGDTASSAILASACQVSTLADLAGLSARLQPAIASILSDRSSESMVALRRLLDDASHHATLRRAELEQLVQRTTALVATDYGFLYDTRSRLLAIGYNTEEDRRDTGHYDLLASEARLCNFVAIAQGSLPQESWFALGRLLVAAGGDPILLSWSGSMFEYLMPMLVMPDFEHTLLARTCSAAVRRQIAYGHQHDVPWGISESGYNAVDAQLNYQYRAFGVPGLGLKRGLAEDLVIAPYASALALMVAPVEACRNLQTLSGQGLAGRYGLYEAIDFTASRLPRGQSSSVIRSFMAHHQGMSLLSLAYCLLDRPMQRRFESEPMFKAVMLLLQERVPRVAIHAPIAPDPALNASAAATAPPPIRLLNTPHTDIPQVQLLSNGRYHVMLTNSGGGYSRWKDLAVTRWAEDPTCDGAGAFCYLRDLDSGACWSSAFQPTHVAPTGYEAIFSEGRVEFRRHDHGLETHTDIAVSPEDDIELRRVRITNRTGQHRSIEITSYAEAVIAPADADSLHPAFSKLFVQTELFPASKAILCKRRPRSVGEPVPTLLHMIRVRSKRAEPVSFETDRARFIGRGRSLAEPLAMRDAAPLSGTCGAVLDPIMAIRTRVSLAPHGTATIDLVIGMADTRDAALVLIDKYQDRMLGDRVFELAWSHSQVLLRQINATEADAQLYARLAGSVIHANSRLRADASVRLRNRRGQSGLWGYAISGDLPIVLLKIGDADNIALVRQMVQAHVYWRLKGLVVDLVIWNEDRGGYRQALHEQILGLVASGLEAHVIDRPGGVFVRSAEHISEEDRLLFESVARVIIADTRGTLTEQVASGDRIERRTTGTAPVERSSPTERRSRRLVPTRADPVDLYPPATAGDPALLRFNGLGGFNADGSEYVIRLGPGMTTPAPWVNVIANANFGTVVSETGSAYTWSENAHEFRLSPWENDPVRDAGGEALYLRDEASGRFWSPSRDLSRTGRCTVRHGFGYSVFEHHEDGIDSELTVFVALEAAIKYSVLKVTNRSGRARSLSATGYVAWVLGDRRARTAMHLCTRADAAAGALYANNPFNSEFASRTAFLAASGSGSDATSAVGAAAAGSWTCDRTEFIGRNGSLDRPAAMRASRLHGREDRFPDPCAAIQMPFELAPGGHHEIVFRLGAAIDAEAASAQVGSDPGPVISRLAHAELDAVRHHWQRTLGALHIETPDPSLDLLVNGWLLYQTLACRVWARSGFYQSGGAIGFRDQLQDLMALVHVKPQLLREHLLLCASRQFLEGDVQHWWHPPGGRGVRTHFSDDFLWLALATCRYVSCTGDLTVLDVDVPYLEARPVNPDDDSYYDLPSRSLEHGSLYQHCVRAIVHGLRFGEHGLPLMGTGDWNDGMNRVGKGGKGESVWLGFFQCQVLEQFSALAATHGDPDFAQRCTTERARLMLALDAHGWDGQWYRRAYFDDGTPLGSSQNAECRIDSIAQSWSVLSGAGDARRAKMAMDSLDERLVRRDHALVQLLDPPFDTSALDPGYIRGYVPGVRENGGQYTHSAIWAAMAFAALGDAARAWELTAMINPLNHADSPSAVAVYKVEPYVIAADVYASEQHAGRGGWSWYTGSSGWMYRLAVESLLGLRREGDRLHCTPCVPAHWPGFSIRYRYGESAYRISVVFDGVIAAPGDTARQSDRTVLTLDGVVRSESSIVLLDDGQDHVVEWRIARSAPRTELET